MLRLGAMNMMLHGIEEPRIFDRDSLAEVGADDAGQYSLILANPPFAGSLDNESVSKDLLKVVGTKKTELLFLALFLRLLTTGGRAAVIVPDGVLFGSSKAHKAMRELLVEKHRLEAVISLPSGVFRPYAGVSTAILVFTKTGRGGTDQVWYYDMQADGMSLDDKRTPLLDESLLGPVPVPTNRAIAGGGGRTYQERAIRAVCHRYEDGTHGGENQRKALLVMATGSGKTRVAIALSDVLMNANWAKRILFLADRVPLVKQATGNYRKYLPDCATVNLVLEPAAEGRVTSSGRMEPELLYAPPFTDSAPNGVSDMFDGAAVETILGLLEEMNPRLAASI